MKCLSLQSQCLYIFFYKKITFNYKITRYQSFSLCLEEEITAWYVLGHMSILNYNYNTDRPCRCKPSFSTFFTIHSHFHKSKNDGKTPTYRLIFFYITFNVLSPFALCTVSHRGNDNYWGSRESLAILTACPSLPGKNTAKLGRNQCKLHCYSQRNISNVNGASHWRDTVKILKYVRKGNYFGH